MFQAPLQVSIVTGRGYPAQVGAVATGLLLTSGLTYAFHVIAARTLSPADFGIFGAMWSLFFLILIVVYLGLEQRIAATVAGGTVGLGGPENLTRFAFLAALGAIAVAVAGLLIGPELSLQTWVLLGVGAAGYAAVYALRGLASGTRRFWRYGSLFATEAGSRLAVIALAILALTTVPVSAFALAMAAAPWIAVALMGWDLRRFGWERQRPPIQLGAVGAIGVANISLAGILNLGPVIVVARQSAEAAGALFAALVIVRVPLYLLQSVTTTLLPYVAGVIASNGAVAARRRVSTIAVGVGFAGVVAVLAGLPLLQWAARVFFGPDLVLPRTEFAILGLGVSGIIASLIINQLFVVAQVENRLAVAWTAGFLTFLVVAFLAQDPRYGVAVGLLAGAATTLSTLSVMARRLRGDISPPSIFAPEDPADGDQP